MNAELLKAGFILIASAGFVIFNISSKRNFKRILKLFIKPREKKDSQPETKKQEQSQPADTKEIEYLKEQIRELQAQIKKKDEQIAEFTLKFAELAQQSNTIASQAQVLHAIDKQKKPNFFQKLLGKGKE